MTKSRRQQRLKRVENPAFSHIVPSTSNVEVKFVDISNSALVPSDSGTVQLIDGATQGTDNVGQRIGRKIRIKRVRVRYSCNYLATNLISGTGYQNGGATIRFAIVYDKQSNGAAPAYSDLYNASGAQNAPLASSSVNNLDRFLFLAERQYMVQSQGPNGYTGEFDVPVNLDVRFNQGSTGSVTDITTGGLFFVFADSNTTGATPGQVAYISRVWFVDE